MTDTIETPEDELASLKQRATDLGVPFSPNIGLETLRERVAAREAQKPAIPAATAVDANERYNQLRLEAMKLVRVRISNLNPSKREYEAEYFRAGNRIVPTVTRLVPFEVDTHVEQILLNHIRTRKYTHIRNTKRDGKEVTEHGLRLEFQIEILPPLTEDELATLAADQAKRQAV